MKTQIPSLNCLQPSVHAFEKKASVSIWKQAAVDQQRSSHAMCRQKERLQRGAQGHKSWHCPTGASATRAAQPCLTGTTLLSPPLGHALKSHLLNGGLQGKPDLWDRHTAQSHLSSLQELEPFGMSAPTLASEKFSILQLMGHAGHSCHYTEAQPRGW